MRFNDDPAHPARWHDVKDLNPLDGSFGGSPAAAGLRRICAVCLCCLLRASPSKHRYLVSLRRPSQAFGSLFFDSMSLFSSALQTSYLRRRRGSNPRLPVHVNHPLSALAGKCTKTVFPAPYPSGPQRRESVALGGVGGIRTRNYQSENLVTLVYRPEIPPGQAAKRVMFYR